MTAKELKMRLDRFEDEEVFIRVAGYDDKEDVTILLKVDMGSLYLSKEDGHINMDFCGSMRTSGRWF